MGQRQVQPTPNYVPKPNNLMEYISLCLLQFLLGDELQPGAAEELCG
jgi:hypothetical protein